MEPVLETILFVLGYVEMEFLHNKNNVIGEFQDQHAVDQSNPMYCLSNLCSCKFLTSGTTCRASAGVCDSPEVCSGSTATCPADSKYGSTVVCRATSNPTCDPAGKWRTEYFVILSQNIVMELQMLVQEICYRRMEQLVMITSIYLVRLFNCVQQLYGWGCLSVWSLHWSGHLLQSGCLLYSSKLLQGICGDGIVATSEQCDLGTNNGRSGYCCTSSCTFSSSSTKCRCELKCLCSR